MKASREVRLKKYAKGSVSADNFEIAQVDLPDLADGEVLVRNIWMSVDPATRIRMADMSGFDSPIPAFTVGAPLDGGAIGEVVKSRSPDFDTGDTVQSWLGWREAFVAPGAALQKINAPGIPVQSLLGPAGVTGLTAYAGLKTALPKAGETIFVSSAAGAVGSIVCQLAKAGGLIVIGSAGGAEKCAYLREIGVDHAIDYKAEPDMLAALRRVAPEGIDIYFDNVAGAQLEAAIAAGRDNARIILCGSVSTVNDEAPSPGPRNLILMIGKQMRMEGVTVFHHFHEMPEFLQELQRLVAAGKMTWRETVFEGIESAPEALAALFDGSALGKALVKLGA
ncbi:NADP-dependent oxidoreductase [Croceicoccus mobilis]|uniref:NADP-dependent oxidoreductase n=2 Tax=Croceicoccus mobilis TaxID=1703339 RepID=A0A916Z403_9SPHN|nr:NADP-dependent oxidoreductase [Croceicoccus mobilis]